MNGTRGRSASARRAATSALLVLAAAWGLTACAARPIYEPVQFPAVPEPPTVDLGGRWVGYSIQPGGGYGVEVFQDRETPVIFELIQTKDRVEGTQRSSDVFGVESALAEVEGVVSGDDLFIRGTRFVGDPGNYCLISAVLRHQQDAMGERLTGEFVRSSEPAACDAWVRGHLVLERGRPGERARR